MTISTVGRSGIRVLLVSAERRSRRTLAALLRDAGYTTSCESNGAIATSPLVHNRTLANHFDVILVDEPDTILDEIDDEELPELLSNYDIDMPVIAVSIMLSQDKITESGYQFVIAKPVYPERLFRAIDLCAIDPFAGDQCAIEHGGVRQHSNG